MAQKNCEECGVLFSYEPPKNYPDRRKYCDSCSAIKKAAYEASKQPGAQTKPTAPAPAPVKPVQQGTLLNVETVLKQLLCDVCEIKELLRGIVSDGQPTS